MEAGTGLPLLRPLALTDEREAMQAHEELAHEGFEFLLALQPGELWPAYVARVSKMPLGVGLPEGWVPATFLVAEAQGQLVGRVSIRHQLNDYLAEYGGHIGYAVRPAVRRRGYATAMLRDALIVGRQLGIERFLITCDVDNVASARVIERCGGVFQGVTQGSDVASSKRHYWVDGV